MAKKKKAPCCDNSQVKRGPWSEEESEKLRAFILKNGHQNWRSLPKLAGLKRCGKSCRLRWMNYLQPGIKRGNFTKEDEDTIIHLHQTHGNKWSMIASYMPGRTDNEIKNVWNTHLKKGKSLSSSNVTNHQASSVSSSSSAVSSLSNDVMNSEKPNQAEEFKGNFGELEPMACGFDLNAPQSLEFLFEDQQIPPPTAANPEESLDIQREEGQELPNQTVEPGQDECNEWLNLDYPTL